MEYFDLEEFKSDVLLLEFLQEEKDKHQTREYLKNKKASEIYEYLTSHKGASSAFIEPPPEDDIPF